jgi:WD40 repeat protein
VLSERAGGYSSVRWTPGMIFKLLTLTQVDGAYLALGTPDGNVELWDVEAKRCLRSMPGHTGVINCLSWYDYLISSGGNVQLMFLFFLQIAGHYHQS